MVGLGQDFHRSTLTPWRPCQNYQIPLPVEMVLTGCHGYWNHCKLHSQILCVHTWENQPRKKKHFNILLPFHHL